MGKHTPGPWTRWRGHAEVYAGEVAINTEDLISGPTIQCVARCEPDDLDLLHDAEEADMQARANAKLIAAAPDLLEACKALLAAHSGICEGDGDMGEDEDCARARRAIAKAEGR